MGIQNDVLRMLEAERGEPVSGERMAETLGLSRTAVWKAVAGLRDRGFRIEAGTNRGYALVSDGNVLLPETVLPLVRCGEVTQLRVLAETGSTNDAARQAAAAGAREGLVIAAEAQTAGRGRQGRSFLSPPGTGLYVSLLLRPRLPAAEAVHITAAAAVAAAAAIEAVSGRRAGIKWVNDIWLEGKKVCGILTEAVVDMESGGLEYAVLGVGINVSPPPGGFPPELRDIAGTVLPGPCGDNERSRLLAALLDAFFPLYRAMPARDWLPDYRDRSLLTGREVRWVQGDRELRGQALGVDEDARLLLRLPDGSLRALSSGEALLVRPLEVEP